MLIKRGLESREYGHGDPLRYRVTPLYPLSAKVGLTSTTSGGRSVGIVRSRTQTTEFYADRTIVYCLLKCVFSEAASGFLLL
jgi:hypothetical protein